MGTAGQRGPRDRATLESMSLEPSPLLIEFADLLREAPAGRALDVASGNGRNAFFLASLGYPVTAIDSWGPGVEFVARRAAELGVEVRTVEGDLTDLDVGGERFAVIASFQPLDRNLVPRIMHSLLPAGLLFFESYTSAERGIPGHDHHRRFLLEPNEALRLFAPLEIIYFREGMLPVDAGGGKVEPHAVARLIARRAGAR